MSPATPHGPPVRRRHHTAIGLAFLTVLSACASPPRARPLDPQALLASVRGERTASPSGPGLSLAEATRRLRANNPDIREARAALDSARRVAAIRTPLPNPTIGLGPLLIGEQDILRGITWGVAGALGWVIPLAPTRCLQDSLNRVQAEAALARAVATEREVWLAMRGEYVMWAMARERETSERGLAEAAEAAVRAARDLAEAGQVSGVDVRLLRLDAAQASAEVLAAEEATVEARSALAARVGMDGDLLRAAAASPLPSLPDAVPPLRDLEDAAASGHPALAVIRAEYLVAEKELRLEAARAVPGLDVGVEYEREDGPVLGIPLGIEIPLFDRGQVGLARALGERDQVRSRYRAELTRRLALVASARSRVAARIRHHARLVSHVAPEAREALDATRRALAAGETDALRYLEVVRANRAVAVQVQTARIEVHDSWMGLEAACGVPLLSFPDSPEASGAAMTEVVR